jgi:hypothetical protein
MIVFCVTLAHLVLIQDLATSVDAMIVVHPPHAILSQKLSTPFRKGGKAYNDCTQNYPLIYCKRLKQ